MRHCAEQPSNDQVLESVPTPLHILMREASFLGMLLKLLLLKSMPLPPVSCKSSVQISARRAGFKCALQSLSTLAQLFQSRGLQVLLTGFQPAERLKIHLVTPTTLPCHAESFIRGPPPLPCALEAAYLLKPETEPDSTSCSI